MRKLLYCLVDVFTNRAFGGNSLAVLTDAQNLSADTMQSLARELNLYVGGQCHFMGEGSIELP